MVQVTLKKHFWDPLYCLLIQLTLSNNNILIIQKRKPVIDHLNVYFLRNKFADFKKLILNETDIPLFSESRLDDNFPNDQDQAKG